MKKKCGNGLAIAGIWVVVSVLCFEAFGQRMIVLTTAMSASREAARVYAQAVDLGRESVLPGPVFLPGVEVFGEPIALPGEGALLVSTGEKIAGPGYGSIASQRLTKLHGAPFLKSPEAIALGTSNWREAPMLGIPDEAGEAMRLVTLGTEENGNAQLQGTVAVFAREASQVFWKEIERWMLPGTPLGAVALAGNRIAALLETPHANGPLIAAGAPGEGALRLHIIPLESAIARYNLTATGFAATPDGARILVLVSGFSAASSASELTSWLHVLDAYRLTEVCAPVELPGTGTGMPGSIQPWRENSCWVATRVPGRDFAYATLVRLESPPVRVAQYALTGASDSFLIAADMRRGMVAVARDEWLELWPLGERGAMGHRFEAPLGRLDWCDEGLLAAEAGRLHLVDPVAGGLLRTVRFQSGWVRSWMVLADEVLPRPDLDGDGVTASREMALGTSDANPDSDGDGIADGVDPEPVRVSPKLEVPDEIVLRGEAAGQEMRAVTPNAAAARNASWGVTVEGENNAWLYRSPRTVDGRQTLIVGVDPSRPFKFETANGVLRVTMQGRIKTVPAAGSPGNVAVRMAPPRRALRRILWVWPTDGKPSFRDASDPRGLRALGDLLSAPPLYFSHVETEGAFEGNLDPYSVTILPLEAASEGALTRQEALEYVRSGGSLLFLGRHLDTAAAPALNDWLRPVGFGIEPSGTVSGRFAASAPEELARYWKSFEVTDGCAIAVADAPEPPPGAIALAAKRYGYGRVAVLAAATPLEGAALASEENRMFAAELFRWLANAAYEVQDLDGDRLPDEIEDRNRNGHWDPGETDFLTADTDGDGVLDGVEDANRNGVVDDGETDPRNADSDGDGVDDGADPEPAPLFGSPMIAALEPAEGPAEGGSIVIVNGRNFTADTNFWLGGAQVIWRRIVSPEHAIVQTPGFSDDAGGWADFRVARNAGGPEGLLPKAFRYQRRSEATVELAVSKPVLKEGVYSGFVRVRIRCDRASIGGAAVLLQPNAPGLRWGAVEVAAKAPQGISCAAQVIGGGGVMITVNAENGARTMGREWARIPWTAPSPLSAAQLPAKNVWVYTPWRTLFFAKVSVAMEME